MHIERHGRRHGDTYLVLNRNTQCLKSTYFPRINLKIYIFQLKIPRGLILQFHNAVLKLIQEESYGNVQEKSEKIREWTFPSIKMLQSFRN